MRLKHLLLLSFTFMLAVAPSVAHARDASAAKAGVVLELNRLETAGEACRATFVFRNDLATTIDELGLELVLFGPADEVIALLALDPGRLPPGKTRVRQFDLKATACNRIARILLNDVSRCKGEGIAPALCLDAVATHSRLDVQLLK